MKRLALLATMLFVSLLLLTGEAGAQQWVASWTASVHGPYPVGNPTAQPELKYAFASAPQGARNQSFRMIVRARCVGTADAHPALQCLRHPAVTFNDTFVGLQESGSAILKGTNQRILFGGQKSVTVPPGQSVVSDAVALPFVKTPPDRCSRGASSRSASMSWARAAR